MTLERARALRRRHDHARFTVLPDAPNDAVCDTCGATTGTTWQGRDAHFQAVMARQRHERAVLLAAWREGRD